MKNNLKPLNNKQGMKKSSGRSQRKAKVKRATKTGGTHLARLAQRRKRTKKTKKEILQ